MLSYGDLSFHTGNKTSCVGNGQLHGRGGCTLVMAGRVVRVPNKYRRYCTVHANGHEAGHGKASSGCGDIGNDSIADNGNR